VRLLREDIELPLEVYRVESIERGERLYQGHRMVRSLGVSPRTETAIVPAGSFLVDVGGPLGALAVMLLEPRSDDSLATWNAFDEGLEVGGDYPVRRVAAKPEYPLLTARLEGGGSAGRTPAGGSRRASSRGTGGAGFVRWLDDAHFMQTKEGKSWKVHAATGRAEPVAEEDRSRIRAALAGLPTIEDGAAGSLSSRATFDANRKGAFVEHDDDLYYSSADGSEARRLTSTPGAEEMAEFSPDGKFVAFVRDNDLFVVDVATGTERALTTGGSDRVRHGKADWVYFEEIFNRRWKAFWWSPDSKHIAFLKIDDRMVPTHHVLVDTGAIRVVEETAYPRAGEPNPHVGFGIVSAAGGAPRYADLSVYSPDSFLISDVGWWPDSSAAYFYGQDRAQTWLDVLKLRPSGGVPERLFRETTKAWVESLGPIRVLKDGTFLITSERDGWKHLYRYNSDGSLENQVTSGDWEVRAVPRVDEESGWVYLTGTRDNPLGSNLYRARLDGSKIERLTEGPGSHATTLSPDGSMFVGIWSSRLTPPQAVLRKNDGSKLRALDDNSASDASDSGDPAREIVKIKTKDGFELEGELLLPANLDTSGETLYPVWLVTYGGPHMPTISDSWRGGGGGAGLEAGLVRDGYIVFRVDPSSASGKGARSAWRAYRKLGVQECEDIKEAVAWLKQRPYVDGSRIGMSGHSYGGYLTAFCMTHSDLFAAGIAGAPVTDWHDYDSIYTERFMDTPQNNPEGYEASSVVKAANKLHGRLLILHGGIDDNVSVRNTMRFVHALQQANKDFELMIYPASRHGIFGGHYSRLQQEFIRRVLGGPKPRETGSETAKAAASDR
jgi:dipeptidyl aminopeptidase/acylaminoacyl peptidase